MRIAFGGLKVYDTPTLSQRCDTYPTRTESNLRAALRANDDLNHDYYKTLDRVHFDGPVPHPHVMDVPQPRGLDNQQKVALLTGNEVGITTLLDNLDTETRKTVHRLFRYHTWNSPSPAEKALRTTLHEMYEIHRGIGGEFKNDVLTDVAKLETDSGMYPDRELGKVDGRSYRLNIEENPPELRRLLRDAAFRGDNGLVYLYTTLNQMKAFFAALPDATNRQASKAPSVAYRRTCQRLVD